jgi:hypothetical protein
VAGTAAVFVTLNCSDWLNFESDNETVQSALAITLVVESKRNEPPLSKIAIEYETASLIGQYRCGLLGVVAARQPWRHEGTAGWDAAWPRQQIRRVLGHQRVPFGRRETAGPACSSEGGRWPRHVPARPAEVHDAVRGHGVQIGPVRHRREQTGSTTVLGVQARTDLWMAHAGAGMGSGRRLAVAPLCGGAANRSLALTAR